MAPVDERGFVRKERCVMDRDQSRTDLRIEWAILVLGLAGVVAIFVPFAAQLSPWRAMPELAASGSWNTESSRALEVYLDITMPTAALAFFLAPLVSYAQLSRCLGRPLSRWERSVLLASAALVAIGCLAVVALGVRSLIGDRGGSDRDAIDLLATILVWIPLLGWGLRSRRRLRRVAAESLAMGVYIGGVAMWGLIVSTMLEPTAAVAGLSCVAYAVSLWRRVRG